MEKKYYKNLKMIVCVGKDNLIGDRTPDENSNGMLWHIKEELMYFKERTMGNTVLFGGTTAKYVPVELMRKNREAKRNRYLSKTRYVVEQSFGTLHRKFRYAQTAYFGLLKVSAQSHLKAMCLNLLKAANRLNVPVAA